VLQAIKLRYAQKEIYTYSGIVLIATNPFARVDSLYVPGMVQVYAGKQRSYGAPHLFAIAEEAFAYVFAPLAFPVEKWHILLYRICQAQELTAFQRHVARPEEPDHRRLR
jgi:hypothetical protein